MHMKRSTVRLAKRYSGDINAYVFCGFVYTRLPGIIGRLFSERILLHPYHTYSICYMTSGANNNIPATSRNALAPHIHNVDFIFFSI